MDVTSGPETVASILTAAFKRAQEAGYVRTREELGDMAGIGSGHVSMILNGDRKRPEVDTLERLALALGMTDDERQHLWAVAGYPTPGGACTMERAIEMEPYLSEEAKRLILGLYHQLRRAPAP